MVVLGFLIGLCSSCVQTVTLWGAYRDFRHSFEKDISVSSRRWGVIRDLGAEALAFRIFGVNLRISNLRVSVLSHAKLYTG